MTTRRFLGAPAEKRIRPFSQLLALALVAVLLLSSTPATGPSNRITQAYYQAPGDPLGTLQGAGPSSPLFYTGDGQRLNNTSFEGSLTPWIPENSTSATGSEAIISPQGFVGASSARLTIVPGNFTPTPYFSLYYPLFLQQVGFQGGVRLRAAVYISTLTGNSTGDRVEVSLSLTTSTGSGGRIHYIFADGSSLPANTTSDTYYKAAGFGTLNQWVLADVNVGADARHLFNATYPSVDAVSEVRLSVFARMFGLQNRDPHLKYVDANNDNVWEAGETVVSDTNLNGFYDTGEAVLSGPNPLPGTPLKSDLKIKYVDSNNNNVWDTNESVVYDGNNDGVYDFNEPSIYGMTPIVGTLLMKPLPRTTSALFDQVELYSASGNYDWVRNGNFDTGTLTGWGYNSSFTVSGSTFASSPFSAKGTAINGAIEMAQSIDGRPQVGAQSRLKASVDVDSMSGTSPYDSVDLWVGLVDSQGTPAFVYYYFKTGDGSIPTNTTDSLYHKAPGFGAAAQWLSLDQSLLAETAALPGYALPFRIVIIVLEVSAPGASASTTAYFDSISMYEPYKPGSVTSNYYGIDGLNSTYVYTGSSIPPGEFYTDLPLGQSVYNITTPENTALATTEYSAQPVGGMLRVDFPVSTSFKHSPTGNWEIFTTSRNAVANVYTADLATNAPTPAYVIGSSANLVSLVRDPLGNAISGAGVNLTLWNVTGPSLVRAWSGISSVQGWFNVTGVTLPSSAGNYKLQATVQSTYVGVRAYSMFVQYALALNIQLSAIQIQSGSSVTISGNVTPIKQGVNVTISFREAGSSVWTPLVLVKTDSNGQYTYSWGPPAGDYEVMATIGDSLTAPAQSQRAQLSVTGQAGLDPTLVLYIATAAAGVSLILLFLARQRRKQKSNKPTVTDAPNG